MKPADESKNKAVADDKLKVACEAQISDDNLEGVSGGYWMVNEGCLPHTAENPVEIV